MLIVLCGNTCVGKDTYQSMLLEKYSNLKRAVSHTTRPKRKGETNGVEYYFVNSDQFMEYYDLGGFIEVRTYNTIQDGEKTTWAYGLSYQEVQKEGAKITILDHQGTKKLLKNKDKDLKVKIIYLYAPDEVLKERSLRRNDEQAEFLRRLEDDNREFEGIEKIADLIIDTNTDNHEGNLDKIKKLLGGDMIER